MTLEENRRPEKSLVGKALSCKCPRCGMGNIYNAGFLNLNLQEKCSQCGLTLANNDNADGPSVLLVWIIGLLLVPSAFLVDQLFNLPLWLMGIIFGAGTLGMALGLMRVSKAFFLNLQYKYRPDNWKQI